MKKKTFFCPKCGSNGDAPEIFVDVCPECASASNWLKVYEMADLSLPCPYITCMSMHDDEIVWGEHHVTNYYYVSLPKNYLPIIDYIYDGKNSRIIDPMNIDWSET